MPEKYNMKKTTKSRLKQFHGDEKKFENTIVNEYLPKVLNGEITIQDIEKELKTSIHTIDRIVKSYYIANGNKEGIEVYTEAKRKNMGHSIEQRKKTENDLEEVRNYKIVDKTNFMALSDEEQDRQIVMKIRKKLLDEKGKNRNYTMSESTTKENVQRIKEYFRHKNNEEQKIVRFSDEDIRNIIFDYPKIVKKDNKSLDEKIEVLKSCDAIGEEKAYEIVKSFPGIMGYDTERTKAQIDLLESEGLLDYVLNKPTGFMNGVDTMYALIEFAKQRYAPNDLKGVTRSNIFMANRVLKKAHNIDYDTLKKQYPYVEKEGERQFDDENKCKINPYAIGICGTTDIDVQKIQDAMENLNVRVNQRQRVKGEE
ncbi:MAG: hypothetical protein J6I85_06575 [Clostridia bacterium]|nr:hypothetical protein [Clostridia bacterium]